MFPWDQPQQQSRAGATGRENVNASNLVSDRSSYAGSIKEQVDQRAAAKAQYKLDQLEADRLDDLRVERESAQYRAEAQGEINAQRQRESLVAQREAQAMARFQGEQSREKKVEAYQQQLESAAAAATAAPQMVAGGRVPLRTEHTGISEHPSTRVHAAPGGNSSFSFSDGSAPQASRQRAAAQSPARQQMDLTPHQANAERHATEQRAAASAIRDRARGGGSLW